MKVYSLVRSYRLMYVDSIKHAYCPEWKAVRVIQERLKLTFVFLDDF